MDKESPLPPIAATEGNYASRRKRLDTPPRFQITERDIEVLRALNRCRYLRTGQVHRVAFSDNTTLQSTRRRLRLLFHNGYIGRVAPFVRAGETPAEEAFFLDKGGIEFLNAQDEDIIGGKRGAQVRPEFLHHALAVSEFRLNAEDALKSHALVELHTLVCDFAVRPHMDSAKGRERHVLYKKLTDPRAATAYEFYPDLLVLMQGRGRFAERQQLLFVEVDCATMSLQRLRQKVIAYHLYREAGLFTAHGAKLTGFTVLIQTTTPRRAENLRAELQGTLGAELVWTTDEGRVSAPTVFSAPVWKDYAGNERQVLRGG
jgi:hypothetical protein